MNDFYRSYVTRLDAKIPSQHKIGSNNWKDYLGQRRYYSDYVEFFEKEILNRGRQEALSIYAPHLFEGLSGQAFHGIIELGFSLELFDDRSNIAEGLAYACFSFSSLGKPANKPEEKNPIDILKKVKEDHFFDGFRHLKFKEAMKKFTESEYQTSLIKYDIAIDNVDKKIMQTLMNNVVEIFLLSGASDFFLLHGVTSTRALKTILSHIRNNEVKRDAIKYLWRGLVCTYIAQGRPAFEELTEYTSNKVSWDDIIYKAINQNDEHLIKLIFVCYEEYLECDQAGKEKGDIGSIFKEAAQRAMATYKENGDHWQF